MSNLSIALQSASDCSAISFRLHRYWKLIALLLATDNSAVASDSFAAGLALCANSCFSRAYLYYMYAQGMMK